MIHAPVERVTEILRDHEDVRVLLDNGWIGDLTVVDPERGNEPFRYAGDLEWTRERAEATGPERTTPVAVSTADD